VVPAAIGIVVALIAAGMYFRPAKAAKLTEKDTVVLAEFANTTGDAVFGRCEEIGFWFAVCPRAVGAAL
jgi:hypothetical protein